MAVDEQQRAAGEIRLNITPRKSHEFVTRLARDEKFRTALEERPAEILREYDIEISPESVPSEIRLPQPEDVEDVLSEMAALDDYGTVGMQPLPHYFFKVFRIFRRQPRR
jgi:hypothetical protein